MRLPNRKLTPEDLRYPPHIALALVQQNIHLGHELIARALRLLHVDRPYTEELAAQLKRAKADWTDINISVLGLVFWPRDSECYIDGYRDEVARNRRLPTRDLFLEWYGYSIGSEIAYPHSAEQAIVDCVDYPTGEPHLYLVPNPAATE